MTARKAPTPATVTEAHHKMVKDVFVRIGDTGTIAIYTAAIAQAIADAEQRGREAGIREAAALGNASGLLLIHTHTILDLLAPDAEGGER